MSKIPDSESRFRVSLMTFSDYYKIQQQFVKPKDVDTYLSHNGGASTVHRPFIGAIYLIKKWMYSTDKSVFIFISDGDTYYPYQQVEQINTMKSIYKHKI